MLFNRFHNAVEFDRPPFNADPSIDHAVNRVTLGFEGTLFDGNASVEIRLPLTDRFSATQSDLSMQADGIGDLSIAAKALLAAGEDSALAIGLAALQAAPTDRWFFHGVVQIDTPMEGIPVALQVDPLFGGDQFQFELTEQTFLYADASVGYWFSRNDQASLVRGIAGLIELHYTTAVDEADLAVVDNGNFVFGNRANRLDALNLTAGLHVELSARTHLRAAAVVPLRQDDNRFFDSEFTLAIIKRL